MAVNFRVDVGRVNRRVQCLNVHPHYFKLLVDPFHFRRGRLGARQRHVENRLTLILQFRGPGAADICHCERGFGLLIRRRPGRLLHQKLVDPLDLQGFEIAPADLHGIAQRIVREFLDRDGPPQALHVGNFARIRHGFHATAQTVIFRLDNPPCIADPVTLVLLQKQPVEPEKLGEL